MNMNMHIQPYQNLTKPNIFNCKSNFLTLTVMQRERKKTLSKISSSHTTNPACLKLKSISTLCTLCLPCPAPRPHLSLLGLLWQNTWDWVIYKQQKIVSHRYRGWEVQDQGTGRFSVWQRSTPYRWCHLSILTWQKRAKGTEHWVFMWLKSNKAREWSFHPQVIYEAAHI